MLALGVLELIIIKIMENDKPDAGITFSSHRINEFKQQVAKEVLHESWDALLLACYSKSESIDPYWLRVCELYGQYKRQEGWDDAVEFGPRWPK